MTSSWLICLGAKLSYFALALCVLYQHQVRRRIAAYEREVLAVRRPLVANKFLVN